MGCDGFNFDSQVSRRDRANRRFYAAILPEELVRMGDAQRCMAAICLRAALHLTSDRAKVVWVVLAF